ncbi:MAG TPA: IMP dehydrogenase [Candidatus Humimicrobiaceae bacterium]|nr:IMP dehydrogenase [Candidatus Humimicrobiaceae bacterium]
MAKLHPDLINKEFWYRDITLIPNRLPDFERDEVDLTIHFTKRILLKAPFVSAPMDTVTEAEMAIIVALYGGIGVIHYNFPTINEQIEEVERVKRFEAGFVFNPVVLSPQNTIKDVYDVNDKYGFFSVPITEDGTLNSKLVGIVTNRDVRYRKDMETRLKEVMTPREKLIIADKSEIVDKNDLKEANEIIRKNNLDTLPIIDEEDRIVALVTDSDLRKNENYPLATKDENKQLRTFVAIEGRLKLAKERIGKAFDAGADGINIEASVVFKEQLEIAKYCKENFPTLDVVMGNVASAEVVRKIIEQGFDYCDAIKIGMGPGAACITQQELGTGRAQASAVWDCCQEAKKLESKYGFMPLIADGGIKILDDINQNIAKPGDITKALALGAKTVMMGSVLAGLDESPGEKEFDYKENRMVKKYRGMGSLEAMEGTSAVRYAVDKVKIKIAEGIVTKVPYRGSGHDFLPRLIVGVKQSLQKQGFKNIKELQEEADIRPI